MDKDPIHVGQLFSGGMWFFQTFFLGESYLLPKFTKS